MSNSRMNIIEFKNSGSPFTELFSLLKRYETLPQGFPTLVYATEELKVIHQHTDNAIEVLLQGLQGLGHLLSVAAEDKEKTVADVNNIGFFMSTISNLTEALNSLRIDTDYVLKQRHEIDY